MCINSAPDIWNPVFSCLNLVTYLNTQQCKLLKEWRVIFPVVKR